jgi:hypothetical protein
MKVTRSLCVLTVLAAMAGGAMAQNASQTNAQRCQQLSQEVNAEFQRAVQARVPKEDPGTFNENGYNIKAIMAQDPTSALGKLTSLNFGSILQSLVNTGVQRTLQRGQQNFSSKMNGVLSSFGISGSTFNTALNTVGVSTPGIAAQTTGVLGNATQIGTTPGINGAAAAPSTSIYTRR